MRTLSEIIDAAKASQPVTGREAYYAMLVLLGLLNMTEKDLRDVVYRSPKPDPVPPALPLMNAARHKAYQEMKAEEAHRRYHVALKVDPKHYLGDSIPSNPSYRAFHEAGSKLLAKIIANMEKPPDIWRAEGEDGYKWHIERLSDGAILCMNMIREDAEALAYHLNAFQWPGAETHYEDYG
jgi:hypothetical protein